MSTIYYETSDELTHYGVPGMKWGIRKVRYQHKASRNSRLEKKALNYDIKSAKASRKSEKIHSKQDLGRSNRQAAKASKYSVKASRLKKKALKTDSDYKQTLLNRKASKYELKSSIARRKANRISKEVGYGLKAMRYSIKSDKFATRAAKARYKIANNKAYMSKMMRKASSVPEKEREAARAFIEALS